jgi:hypothetical protein
MPAVVWIRVRKPSYEARIIMINTTSALTNHGFQIFSETEKEQYVEN